MKFLWQFKTVHPILLTLWLVMPVWANNVFVGNQPFEGRAVGTGSEVRLSLLDLADALEVDTALVEGKGWVLGGFPVETFEDFGITWVKLRDLPQKLVRVVRSEELNTVDIYRKKDVASAPDDNWGADGALVYFYATWSPACQAMEETINVLERSRTIKLVRLNIEEPHSRNYRRYVRYFEGNRIPFFVVLNSEGRKITTFASFQSYAGLLDRLKKAFQE